MGLLLTLERMRMQYVSGGEDRGGITGYAGLPSRCAYDSLVGAADPLGCAARLMPVNYPHR